jgi:hypothetical protein
MPHDAAAIALLRFQRLHFDITAAIQLCHCLLHADAAQASSFSCHFTFIADIIAIVFRFRHMPLRHLLDYFHFHYFHISFHSAPLFHFRFLSALSLFSSSASIQDFHFAAFI